MIPRYSQTYRITDLFRSWNNRSRAYLEEKLRYQLAELYNVRHVYLLRTAGAALYALLKAYNRPGGVLTSAYNDLVVPEVIEYAGYHPVFADIDYKTLQMDIDSVDRASLSDISVIVPVHLFGVPCEWGGVERIQEIEKPLIIEDVAPAFGAEYRGLPAGSFGDAAIISFHHTKIVSAEIGGVLITNDDELTKKIEQVLKEFDDPKEDFSLFTKALARKIITGRNIYSITQFLYRLLFGEQMYQIAPLRPAPPKKFFSHCPRFASALILNQLDRLDWNLSRRRRIAQIYLEELSDISGLTLPIIPEKCAPAWMQLPVLVSDIIVKEKFYKYMQKNGIDLSWTWRYSCAESFGLDGFPNTQKAAKTLLGLPTYPSLSNEDAHSICEIVRTFRFD